VAKRREQPQLVSADYTLVGSELNDSAFQPNRDRVGAVVGVELGENVRHVPLDGILGYGQLSSDLFVGVTA
jgi:hypothetical protein